MTNPWTVIALATLVAMMPLAVHSQDASSPPTSETEVSDADLLVRTVLSSAADRQKALRIIEERGKTDVVAALITMLRYITDDQPIIETLRTLTKADVDGDDWHDWMLWQEAHPEIKPYAGFDGFKADVLRSIDENYRTMVRRGIKHDIRLEEITWGGVPALTGIPSLDYPNHVTPAEARYITDDELVFGVVINGDVRAYPLRFLAWHEMFNDVVGGKHVTLAYCTLCGSGILFDSTVAPRTKPFKFGSSGLLYRSNKLMYDHGTKSLWNQFTGRPVVGPLAGTGIELTVLPVTITTWKNWLARQPATKVLSEKTGYVRDYSPGRPYADYFSSDKLMFPALVRDARLKAKDYVFAARAFGAEKAWPVTAFEGGKVINDTLGSDDVVLVGDAATRTVRAYRRDGRSFEQAAADLSTLKAKDGEWKVAEDALIGVDGTKLPRIAGHIAYWFAWQGYKPKADFGG